jgi:hypothetical protein
MALHFVRQVPFTAGTTETRDLNAVPAKNPQGLPYGIRGILLQCQLTLVSAATSDAVAQGGYARLINTVQFFDAAGRPFVTENPVSGRALRGLLSLVRFRGYSDPTALSANTNTTNTKKVNFYIPFTFPEMLEEKDIHVPLAALLRDGRIEINWCAATEFGTGQVITAASTYCNIYLDIVPLRKVESAPQLIIGTKVPDTYDRYRLPLHGKPLCLALVNPSAAGAVGSTDFTNLEIRGDTIDMNRQDIDAPTHHYNTAIINDDDGDGGYKALPSSGSAEELLMFVGRKMESIAKLPTETEPVITWTQGAGAPALTKYVVAYIVSRPSDDAHFADVVGRSSQVALSREDVQKGLSEGLARGKGSLVSRSEAPHTFGWLRKPVPVGKGA